MTIITADLTYKADLRIEGVKVAPVTMVMCPCLGGPSHNEAEEISKEWATAGADVLFHAVVETAEIVV